MPLNSKGKRKAKNQVRNAKRSYKKTHHITSINDHDIEVNKFNRLDVSNRKWGNDDNSKWDDIKDMEAAIRINTKLKKLSLV
ncbi:hypothetical protein G9A89_009927 [Geosiphon pyriformis]|nr:hypothetical protein G9A89_009927 [Geosiphon pyriformis]